MKKFFSRLAVVGAEYVIFYLALGAAIFGASRGVRAFFIIGISLLIAWICTLALQFLIRRTRPFVPANRQPLIHLLFQTPSFPSGHATMAFAMAGAVAFQAPLVGAILLVLAVWVAWARVAVGVHYISDALAGSFIGLIVSFLFSFYG